MAVLNFHTPTSLPATSPEAIAKDTPNDFAIKVRMESRFFI
jgi:hypothetical protein